MRVRVKNVNLEGSRRARAPEPKCCTLSIANVRVLVYGILSDQNLDSESLAVPEYAT